MFWAIPFDELDIQNRDGIIVKIFDLSFSLKKKFKKAIFTIETFKFCSGTTAYFLHSSHLSLLSNLSTFCPFLLRRRAMNVCSHYDCILSKNERAKKRFQLLVCELVCDISFDAFPHTYARARFCS